MGKPHDLMDRDYLRTMDESQLWSLRERTIRSRDELSGYIINIDAVLSEHRAEPDVRR